MTETTWDKVKQALEPYKLRQVGRDEWRSNRPWSTGSDSMGLTVHPIPGGEYGMWNDHVDRTGGSLYELAARLNIETPKRDPITVTKRGYTGLADYADAHGAPAEAFESAKWKEVMHKSSSGPARLALEFRVAGQPRYRFIDGDNPAFFWKKGSTPAWYGHVRAIEIARRTGRDLVYVNGAATVVVAQWYDIPACTIEGGEESIKGDLLDLILQLWDGAFIFALDSDYTGQKAAMGSIEAMIERGRKARNADLMLSARGDLCDFRRLYEDKTYAELDRRAIVPVFGEEPPPSLDAVTATARQLEAEVKAAQLDPLAAQAAAIIKLEAQVERIAAAVAPPRIIELHELADGALSTDHDLRAWPVIPIPELSRMVGPLKPELYVIYGATGMGKSWFASTLAASLSMTGTGLLISTEMNPGDFFRRMVSAVAHVPLILMDDHTASDLERTVWNKAAARFRGHEGRALDLSSPTPKQVEREARRAKDEIGLDFMIIDSATRMKADGDGIYERMSSIANALQNMARDYNIPVIVTSQVGRDVTERPMGKRHPRLDDAYGSGAIEQNAGVVIGLYRHAYYVQKGLEKPDDDAYPPDTARMEVLKHRHRPLPDVPVCTVTYEQGCGFYTRGGQ